MPVGQVQRLAELPCEHGGGAQVTRLAGFYHVVQGFQRFLDRCLVVPAVDLIKVRIALRDSPRPLGSSGRMAPYTLVAATTLSRLAMSRSVRPKTSSLVPPE